MIFKDYEITGQHVKTSRKRESRSNGILKLRYDSGEIRTRAPEDCGII